MTGHLTHKQPTWAVSAHAGVILGAHHALSRTSDCSWCTPGQGLCVQHQPQGVTCKQCWNVALPHLLGKNISEHHLQLEMNSIFKLAAN